MNIYVVFIKCENKGNTLYHTIQFALEDRPTDEQIISYWIRIGGYPEEIKEINVTEYRILKSIMCLP